MRILLVEDNAKLAAGMAAVLSAGGFQVDRVADGTDAELGVALGDGVLAAEVSHAVAGVVDPPGPQEVHDLVDAVLHGVYAGDLAVALERAAAFCRVVSAGRGAQDAPRSEPVHPGGVARDEGARRGLALLDTAADLSAGAVLWRAGQLV